MCKYNTIICFQLNRLIFFLSLNGKLTSQKATKNSTSRIRDANNITARSYDRHIKLFCLYRLARKLLQHHPDTRYIRKQKCHTLSSKNIPKNIFSLKSAIKLKYSASAGKAIAGFQCHAIQSRSK